MENFKRRVCTCTKEVDEIGLVKLQTIFRCHCIKCYEIRMNFLFDIHQGRIGTKEDSEWLKKFIGVMYLFAEGRYEQIYPPSRLIKK